MRPSFVLLAAALAAPAGLSAQDAPRQLNIVTDLGFVNAAGNTDITTLNVGERLTWRSADSVWLFAQFAGAVYGRTSGEETANQLTAGLRLDRGLARRLYAFAGIKWDRDRFAGIDRRFEEVLGLAFRAVETAQTLALLEGGAAFTQKRSITAVEENFVAVRLAGTFKQALSASAFFQQLAEVLPNLEDGDDVRVNTESSLVAPLSRQIAIKLAYAIRFDNQPEPGFRKTDRVFTSGVQIAF